MGLSSRDFDPQLKEAWQIVEHIAMRRGDYSTVFSDFLYMFLAGLMVNKHPDVDNQLETYREKYDVEERHMFGRMIEVFLKAINHYAADYMTQDPFGEFYMALLSNSKASAFGQFFTPMPVCRLMADMMNYDFDRYSADDPMFINDCAAGSGRTLLAAHDRVLQYFIEAKLSPYEKWNLVYYVAEDLDPMCVNMCALNMLLNGMRGESIRHNSLSDPMGVDGMWLVNRFPMMHNGMPHVYYSTNPADSLGINRKAEPRQTVSEDMVKAKEVIAPQPKTDKPGHQLTLF